MGIFFSSNVCLSMWKNVMHSISYWNVIIWTILGIRVCALLLLLVFWFEVYLLYSKYLCVFFLLFSVKKITFISNDYYYIRYRCTSHRMGCIEKSLAFESFPLPSNCLHFWLIRNTEPNYEKLAYKNSLLQANIETFRYIQRNCDRYICTITVEVFITR